VRKVNADDKRQAAELIELDGGDLRRGPLEARSPGLRLNELRLTGLTVFAHACKMGLEGIVSKAEGLSLALRPLAGLAQD
jgi:hypothetical protein